MSEIIDVRGHGCNHAHPVSIPKVGTNKCVYRLISEAHPANCPKMHAEPGGPAEGGSLHFYCSTCDMGFTGQEVSKTND